MPLPPSLPAFSLRGVKKHTKIELGAFLHRTMQTEPSWHDRARTPKLFPSFLREGDAGGASDFCREKIMISTLTALACDAFEKDLHA